MRSGLYRIQHFDLKFGRSFAQPRLSLRSCWRLAPAYDLNPVPVDIKPRILTTAIDEADGTASLDLAFAVAEHFGLKPNNARKIAHEVGNAVKNWRLTAKTLGLSMDQISRVASAFEHQELEQAISGTV